MTSRYNLRSRRNAASMEVDIPVTDLKSQKRNVSSRKNRQKPRTTSPSVLPTQTAVQSDGASRVNSPDSPVSDSLPTATQADQDQAPAICDGYQEYCSPFPVSEPVYEKDTLPCVEVNLTSAELRLLPFRFQLSGATCDIHLPEVMPDPRQMKYRGLYSRKPWFH